jgi:hypothetical protein
MAITATSMALLKSFEVFGCGPNGSSKDLNPIQRPVFQIDHSDQ